MTFVPYEFGYSPFGVSEEMSEHQNAKNRAIGNTLAQAIANLEGRTEIYQHDQSLGWQLHILSKYSWHQLKHSKETEKWYQKNIKPSLANKDLNEIKNVRFPIPYTHVIDDDYNLIDKLKEMLIEIFTR